VLKHNIVSNNSDECFFCGLKKAHLAKPLQGKALSIYIVLFIFQESELFEGGEELQCALDPA